ncbi:MAG: PIG-L family deacetylase [Anaerolineaceae bacterium]|nr:PIG-L family deacetylase [Anaerolineaceae bacterium]
MRYIFISPHLDDVALSVGGIVNNLVNNKIDTEIWTVFSGSPTNENLSDFALSLHKRWDLPLNAPKKRRLEDRKACKTLGVGYKHFNLPDCIYRKDQQGNPIVSEEDDLYQPIPASQQFLVKKISAVINRNTTTDDIVISPMAIGNHIDHRIVVAAIEKVSPLFLFFYEDYPYVIKSQTSTINYSKLIPIKFDLQSENIKTWHAAINAYQSQISTFWKNTNRMKEEIIEFASRGGGKYLWKSS